MREQFTKFKADLMKKLATLEEAQEGEDVINLFDDHPHVHKKRPLESDDEP